jgi:hypothetical protein
VEQLNPIQWIGRFLRHFWRKYLPNKLPNPVFSETRDKITPPIREIKTIQKAENLPIESAKTPDTYPVRIVQAKIL